MSPGTAVHLSLMSLTYRIVYFANGRFEVVGCRMIMFTMEQTAAVVRMLKLHADVVSTRNLLVNVNQSVSHSSLLR